MTCWKIFIIYCFYWLEWVREKEKHESVSTEFQFAVFSSYLLFSLSHICQIFNAVGVVEAVAGWIIQKLKMRREKKTEIWRDRKN